MDVRRRQLVSAGMTGLAATALSGCWLSNILKPTPVDECSPSDRSSPCSGVETAQVNIAQLSQAVMTQQCEAWCWAASISMLFDFYGHPLSQAAIVAATYGSVVCLPSGPTLNIGRDLSRSYVDQHGRLFTSQVVAAYDPGNSYYGFTNRTVIDALTSNNPLLYCNTHHAMVVYSVRYVPNSIGPIIRSVQVVDPWPLSARTHDLTPGEMTPAHLPGGEMTFLAQIVVR